MSVRSMSLVGGVGDDVGLIWTTDEEDANSPLSDEGSSLLRGEVRENPGSKCQNSPCHSQFPLSSTTPPLWSRSEPTPFATVWWATAAPPGGHTATASATVDASAVPLIF